MLSQTQWKQHPSDEVVESYTLGRLNGNQSIALEEHLFTCEQCQTRLTEADQCILALSDAAREIFREPASRERRSFWPVWVAAYAAFALALFLPWQANRAITLHEVELKDARGPAALRSIAQAPLGERMALNLDVTEVASSPSYRLELVNGSGQRAWSGLVKAHRNRIRVEPNVSLPAGIYWAHLYLPADPPSLLREYGLEIR